MSNEAKLLSAVLNDKQIGTMLQANVGDLLRTHNDVWEFIHSYYEQNHVVPPVMLVEAKFPDFEYTNDKVSTAYCLDEVRAEFLDDQVRTMLRVAAEEVKRGNPALALDTIVSDTARIKRLSTNVRDIDVMDVDAAINHFKTVADLQASGYRGITVGLAGFDDYLPSGIVPGMFGVLLAYPSIGKSWFAQYMAVQAWRQGYSPMIISLEMTETEVRNRVYTILGNGRWSHKNLSAGKVELDMFEKWAHETFDGKPPITIISNEGIGEINPQVVRGKIDQHKPSIVFIDYLNLMSSNARSESETVKMKNLSRELKLLAISDQIPIVAISSATPDDVTDMNSAPTLGQVSWSKQVAYDADWLLALGREKNSDVMSVVWRKNRNGMMSDFYVQVDFDKGRFIYKSYDG